ncbi:MAG: TolB family protein [Phycisphaerales bacterium JB059]
MFRQHGLCGLIAACGVGSVMSASAWAGPELFIRGLTWDGRVVDIDLDTGHATQIAAGAGFRANSLTMAPDGSLMFINRDNGQTLSTLSADGTSIVESRTLDRSIDVRALAWDGNGDMVAFGPHPTEFGAGVWSIDSATLGVSGPIRVTRGDTTPYSGFQSAEYAPDGTLYAWSSNSSAQFADGLVTIDPETGVGTDVSPAFNNGAVFQSIAFAPDGRLFAVTANTLSSSGVDSYSLFEIDPLLGTFEVIGAFGEDFDVRGIAVIPAPGGVGVLALALVGVRRRRRG